MPDFPVEPRSLTDAAELLKAMAHPVRLCLVTGLVRNGGCIVREMQHCLGVPQATISQHLARLKAAGIVSASRAGNQVRYEVISALARQVAEAVLAVAGECVKS